MVQSLRRSKSFRILFNSPELVEEQRSGFHHFLKHGIAEELSKISFLEVKRQNVDIEVFLDANSFQLIAPDDNSRNCVIKMKTYACKLYVQIRIVWKKKSGEILIQTEPEWVLLGHLPMMTKRGHFVINGSPRVIVHQVVRAPGVYFQKFGKVKKDERNKARFYGDIIPRKGVWVRLQISKTGQVEIKLKKSTKVQAEMVERCLAVIEKQELSKGLTYAQQQFPLEGQSISTPETGNRNVLPTSSQFKRLFDPARAERSSAHFRFAKVRGGGGVTGTGQAFGVPAVALSLRSLSHTPLSPAPAPAPAPFGGGGGVQSFAPRPLRGRGSKAKLCKLRPKVCESERSGRASEPSGRASEPSGRASELKLRRSSFQQNQTVTSTKRKFVGFRYPKVWREAPRELSNSVRHAVSQKRAEIVELRSNQYQVAHNFAWIRKTFSLLLSCFGDLAAPAIGSDRPVEKFATLRSHNIVTVPPWLPKERFGNQARSSKVLAFDTRKFGASGLERTALELAYSALGVMPTRATPARLSANRPKVSRKCAKVQVTARPANENVVLGRSCSDTQSKIKKGYSVKGKATRELAHFSEAKVSSEKVSKHPTKFNKNYCSRSQFMAITGISKPFLELGAVRSRAITFGLRRATQSLALVATQRKQGPVKTQKAETVPSNDLISRSNQKNVQSNTWSKQHCHSIEDLVRGAKGTQGGQRARKSLLDYQYKVTDAKRHGGGVHRLQNRTFVVRARTTSVETVRGYQRGSVFGSFGSKQDRVVTSIRESEAVDTLKSTKTGGLPERLAPLSFRLPRHSRNGFDNGASTTRYEPPTRQGVARKDLSENFAKAELKGDDRAFTNVYDNLYRVPEMKELEDKMYPKGSSISIDTEFKRNFSYKHIFATFKAPWRYSLGTVGRHKLNKKFGLDLSETQLTSLDLQAARNWLYRLRDGKEIIDDIDHFQNRRVRQSGELIQNQFENGVTRLRKLVRRKLRTPTFDSLPFELIRKSCQKIVPSTTFSKLPVELSRQALAGPFLKTFSNFRRAGRLAKVQVQRPVRRKFAYGGQKYKRRFMFDEACKSGAFESDGFVKVTRAVGTSLFFYDRASILPGRAESTATTTLAALQVELSGAKQEGSNHGRANADSNSSIAGVKARQPELSSGVKPRQPRVRFGAAPREAKLPTLSLRSLSRSENASEAAADLYSAKYSESIKKSSLFSRANLWQLRETLCFYTRDKLQQLPQWQLRINSRQTPFHYFIPRLLLTDGRGLLKKAWNRNLTDLKEKQADRAIDRVFSPPKNRLWTPPALGVATPAFSLPAVALSLRSLSRSENASEQKLLKVVPLGWPSANALAAERSYATQGLDSGQSTQTVLDTHERFSILCTIERSVNKSAPVAGFAFVKPTHSSLVITGRAKYTKGQLLLVLTKGEQNGEYGHERSKTSRDGSLTQLKSEPPSGLRPTKGIGKVVSKTPPLGLSKSESKSTAFDKSVPLKRSSKRESTNFRETKTISVNRTFKQASELFSTKPINGALREFFGSNPLSQYMDQTNPLAELTHKRRISSLGIGGVSRESAGMAIRGIHPTHYGRICPIETPEGKNAGLVNSLALYARLNNHGFIETPYYKVIKGQVQEELGFSFYSALKETVDRLHLAPSDLQQSQANMLGVLDRTINKMEKLRPTRQTFAKRKVLAPSLRESLPLHTFGVKAIASRLETRQEPVDSSAFLSTKTSPLVNGETAVAHFRRPELRPPSLPPPSEEGAGEQSETLQAAGEGERSSAADRTITFAPKKSGRFRVYSLTPRVSEEGVHKGVQLTGDLVQANSGCLVPVRVADTLLDVFKKVTPYEVDCIGISPVQILSVATSLIPFLEHNDANRALMGSNMQRQAVPLMISERPIVGTGLETLIVAESGQVIQSSISGLVSHVSANKIIIERLFNTGTKNDSKQLSNVFPKTFYHRPISPKKIGELLLSEAEHSCQNRLRSRKTFAKAKLSFAETKPIKLHYLSMLRRNNSLLCLQWGTPQIWLNSILSTCASEHPSEFSSHLHSRQTRAVAHFCSLSAGRQKVRVDGRLPRVSETNVRVPGTGQTLVERKLRRGKASLELQFDNRNGCSATQSKLPRSAPGKGDRSFSDPSLVGQEHATPVLAPTDQPKLTSVKTSKNQKYVPYVRPTRAVARVVGRLANVTAGYKALCTKTLLRKATCFSVSKYKKPKNCALCSELTQLYKNRSQQSRYKLPVLGSLNVANPALLTVQQRGRSSSSSTNFRQTRAVAHFCSLSAGRQKVRVDDQTLACSCSPSCSCSASLSKKVSTSKRVSTREFFAKGIQAQLLLGSPRSRAIAQGAPNPRFAETFKQMTLLPFVHSLRSFTRSNQETCLTQKPLVQEGEWVQKGDILTDCSASEKGELAVGKNVMIAYLPWEGYNFEDAIVVSDRLTKEQVYASLHIERYVCEAQDIKEKITNSNEWFTRDLPGVHPKLVSHLDNFGFPKIGTILKEGDILVGKMRYFRNKPTTPYEKLLSDILGDGHFSVSLTSLRVPKGVHEARVISHRVVKTFRSSLESTFTGVSRPAGTPKMVHIFLGEKRSIQIGDKMSGRHGNKGIISTILPKQDMPYLPDGSPIDILLNPLGVPSRMNVGQIFESLLGLASTYLNQNFKITAFDELYGVEASQSLVYLKLYQARLQSGQNWLFQINFPGKTRLIDGRSGECFDQWVTVGKAYMLKLIHMVNEKIHARNTGPYALITQQPLRGRSQKGGQRLGEMEVWALEGYGAAYILQELLTKKSDDFAGRQEIINSLVVRSDKFSSPDNPYRDYSNPDDPYQRFSDPDNPYQVIQETRLVLGHPEIFKTLICELQALCLDVGVYALKKESFQREYLGIVN